MYVARRVPRFGYCPQIYDLVFPACCDASVACVLIGDGQCAGFLLVQGSACSASSSLPPSFQVDHKLHYSESRGRKIIRRRFGPSRSFWVALATARFLGRGELSRKCVFVYSDFTPLLCRAPRKWLEDFAGTLGLLFLGQLAGNRIRKGIVMPTLLFREIEQMVSEAKAGLALLGSEDDVCLPECRLAVLSDLVTYIRSYDWLTHQALVEKIQTFLRSQYNYAVVAREHGLSLKQAHKSVSYANARLRSKIGGILHLIRSEHFTAAQRELAILRGTMPPSTWFLKEVSDRFQPAKDAGVVVSEVSRRELAFLRLFSQAGFARAVSSLQAPIVQHILYILSSSDVGYLREKDWLYKCLIEGTATVDECIRALDEEFVWGAPSNGPGGPS